MKAWVEIIYRMINRNRRSVASIVGIIAIAVFLYAAANPKTATLSTTVLDMISRYHVSPTPVDDAYSKRVFDLYIKQLDPGKRFFMESDIISLKIYETELDDQLKSGNMVFVEKANAILLQRVAEAQQVVAGLIQTPQSFTSTESITTDWDQRQFAPSRSEWNADWRRFVQYQVLTNYIVAGESSSVNANALTTLDTNLEREARQKAEKNIASFFDRITRETTQDRINAFIDVAASAQDPHSAYLAPQQKDDFDINIKGTLEGIGALLQEEDGYIKVSRIVPGGPA
jgi:carboxyl-terminal processing protease